LLPHFDKIIKMTRRITNNKCNVQKLIMSNWLWMIWQFDEFTFFVFFANTMGWHVRLIWRENWQKFLWLTFNEIENSWIWISSIPWAVCNVGIIIKIFEFPKIALFGANVLEKKNYNYGNKSNFFMSGIQ
jgi:hypothetical protein